MFIGLNIKKELINSRKPNYNPSLVMTFLECLSVFDFMKLKLLNKKTFYQNDEMNRKSFFSKSNFNLIIKYLSRIGNLSQDSP